MEFSVDLDLSNAPGKHVFGSEKDLDDRLRLIAIPKKTTHRRGCGVRYIKIKDVARFFGLVLLVLSAVRVARTQDKLIPVKVELLTRAVSKTPVLIAYDDGIYKKYGLDVHLWLSPGEEPGLVEIGGKPMEHPDFSVDGGVPMMTSIIDHHGPTRIILETTDCEVRFNIIGQKGMKSLEDLKGKRLGVSSDRAMTGFIGRLVAQRMHWVIGKDLTLVEHAERTEDLRDGKVDAIVADERYMATATKAGLPVLANTSAWNTPIAGNSVRVERTWLQDPKNRDIAFRFLKATIEGIAIYHENRAEALRVITKYQAKEPELANKVYEGGLMMSRKPYPCYAGIRKAMDVYDTPEMHKYKVTDFYDDSLMKDLDKSGFIDKAYKEAAAKETN